MGPEHIGFLFLISELLILLLQPFSSGCRFFHFPCFGSDSFHWHFLSYV